MATKIELECKLLMVEHSIKSNANNEGAFAFRAQMEMDGQKSESLKETARYFSARKMEQQEKAANLRAEIAALN